MIFQVKVNPGMSLLVSIALTAVLFLSYYIIYRYTEKTPNLDRNLYSRSALFSSLINFALIYLIILYFPLFEDISDIFTAFSKPHFLLAIMFTLFLPLFYIFRKKFTPDQKISEEYKKWNKNFLVLYWILTLLLLPLDLFSNQLVDFGFTRGLVTLEFFWGTGIVLILFFLSDIINAYSKTPKIIINKTKLTSGFISYFVWIYMALIFGVYLEFFSIFEDIRIQILSMTIIYFISFYYYLNNKYLPESAQKEEQKLKDAELNLLDNSRKKEKELQTELVIKVEGLKTYFYTEEGVVKALEDISFEINKGEVLGLVGETGCGKSVTALSIQKLILPPGKIEAGIVNYLGEDLQKKTDKEMLEYRGKEIAMIFQDPLNSINPVFKVGDQISEVYLLHMKNELLKTIYQYSILIDEKKSQILELEKKIKTISLKNTIPSSDTKSKELKIISEFTSEMRKLKMELSNLNKYSSFQGVAKQWAIELLDDLNIPNPEIIYDQYPHALSGGMRQRIQIAMAIACSPKLLIADEPTTALDVTIQNQILKLMQDLKKKYDTSILFITHDLGIISRMCDKVAVMYSGYIVEYGAKRILFKNQFHPYTLALINSVPNVGEKKEELSVIQGSVPNLIYPPSGCRFHPRCPYRFKPCDSQIPKSFEVDSDYYVACHLYDPKYKEITVDSRKKILQN